MKNKELLKKACDKFCAEWPDDKFNMQSYYAIIELTPAFPTRQRKQRHINYGARR